MRLLVAGLFSSVLLGMSMTAGAITRTEDFELTIPDTTLQITGYAAPGALVTFTENGAVLGTTVALADGSFATLLTSQKSGIRNINTYFEDEDGIRSATSADSVSVQSQQQTSLDVYISPTIIRKTPAEVQQGSIIQVTGYTVANASVALSFGIAGDEIVTVAGVDGFYEFLLDTDDLADGTYDVFVVSTISSPVSSTSDTSEEVSFTLVSITEPSPSEPDVTVPDIIVSPNQLPPPIPQSPDDGAIIVGDSVTITGESVPNAQIIVYENGDAIGSVFADASGQWSFEYTATSSPVTLTFEACRNGVCSVLSQSLSLSFEFTRSQTCTDRNVFELADYRFWGVSAREFITLDVLITNGDGVLFVDWGDGNPVERFDHDADRPDGYQHAYSSGQFNGTARFVQGECEIVRYFSVDATATNDTNFNYWLVLVLTLIILPFTAYSYNRGKEIEPPTEN